MNDNTVPHDLMETTTDRRTSAPRSIRLAALLLVLVGMERLGGIAYAQYAHGPDWSVGYTVDFVWGLVAIALVPGILRGSRAAWCGTCGFAWVITTLAAVGVIVTGFLIVLSLGRNSDNPLDGGLFTYCGFWQVVSLVVYGVIIYVLGSSSARKYCSIDR